MHHLKHVFAILTLQTGTVAFSWFFFMLAHCIFVVNVLSLDPEMPLAWIIVFLFVVVMIITWIVAFVGAIRESQMLISTAVVVWAIQSVVWAILVIWSFFHVAANKNTCLETRCPEVLWLLNNPWREPGRPAVNGTAADSAKYSKFIRRPVYEQKNNALWAEPRDTRSSRNETTAAAAAAAAANVTGEETNDGTTSSPNNETSSPNDETSSSSPNGLGGLIVSVIVMISYAATFTFSWMVLIGYRKELELNASDPTNGE